MFKFCPCHVVVYLHHFNWKLLKPQNLPNPPKPPKVLHFIHILSSNIFGTLKSPPSTVHPSLQGREAFVAPGVDLGPRRQQHPADLRAAVDRRDVQRGVADDVPRGHGAGHRPQDVPDPPEVTAGGRRDGVVVASEHHGPPREGTGRAAEATTETQKIVEHVECFLSFFESTTMCIDVY